MHGELLLRLRNGKDCTDLLATSELAGAIASPHREVNRAKAFVEGILQQQQQQQSPATAVVAVGRAAVVVGRALLRPVIEEPLRVLQEEGLMRGAEAEEEKEEGGAPPGYLEYGNDDMGFDGDEEVAAEAVEEVGGKRGRKTKPVSAAEAEEKKESKRAAERKRREQETKRIAELPTPDRNAARKERSDVEAARKRTQRKK
jgi:hypothetical protein